MNYGLVLSHGGSEEMVRSQGREAEGVVGRELLDGLPRGWELSEALL